MAAGSRVLVVDDEPIVHESCRRVLGDEGYQVATADGGREGLARARSEHFDVVVTDLKMPDLDGMELVRALRGGQPAVPVVVITGYGTVPSAVEALQLGAADYLEKPFTPQQLSAAVHGALGEDDEPEQAPAAIDGALVREVLQRASADPSFGSRLLSEGSRVLSGLVLSPEAEAAIVSGDIAWIESRCGELSPEERDWLERRLEAEIW